jgi:hypothetical protein
MAELNNDNSPSTVLPTSAEPAVDETILSREDVSREDGKRKSDSSNLPDYCKRNKIIKFVTQSSFDSIADNNDSVHHNTHINNDDSGSESSNNSPRFTHHEGPHPSELFINDGSQKHYNPNWSYINLAQLQSTEDVCVLNKVILLEVLYYVLAKQDSKVEYTTRSGKTSHATFERMLFAMDLHAKKGVNVCVFLLGKKQNAEIFSSCLDQRDTSVFGKSCIDAFWLFLLQSNSNHIYYTVSSWSIVYSRKSSNYTKVDVQWNTAVNFHCPIYQVCSE